MKIINWNVERPKVNQLDKINFIQNTIKDIDADLIFLTETNSIINLGKEYFKLESAPLPEFHEKQKYFKGENRVSIYSKYPIIEENKTYDNFTSICGKIKTEFGELTLYGSIIGSFGGRDEHFKNDLENQKIEIKNLKGTVCFSGDFNILTKENEDSAMHVVLSNEFLKDKNYHQRMMKIDRKISDHNLVICEITSNN